MKVIAINSQSILDIAIQVHGSVDQAFAFALANGLSVTDEIQAGSEIQVPSDETYKNIDLTNYFQRKHITTYKALPEQGDISPDPGGIGYMRIFFDFIVQ